MAEQSTEAEHPLRYGGRNDEALWMVSETLLGDDEFLLRAIEKTGDIVVNINCNDIFAWGCSDAQELPDDKWKDFEDSLEKAREKFGFKAPWFVAAWAVKLREVAPQKPATDRYPAFVEMLDFLEIPWREMKRYDQMT